MPWLRKPPLLLLLIVLFVAFVFVANAQEAEQRGALEAELSERTGDFLRQIADGEPKLAFESLLTDGPLRAESEAIEGLMAKVPDIHRLYGDCRGIEQVALRRVGDDVVICHYLYKCERFPVAWHLTYYRPESDAKTDRWHVVTVRFDTNLEDLDAS